MKKKLLIMGLALAMLFGVEYKDRAEARTTISLNVFFDSLAPYGDWVSAPDYGYVWYPRGVGRSWRPYSDGQWLWSDHGWLWSSYEPWGWATYHYGRWVYDNYYGWVWVPGTVWAPAWVTWYTSPGYVGWAPLPPDDYFFSGIGIGFNYHNYNDYDDYYYRDRHRRHSYIDPSHCVFVPSRHFLDHRIHSVAVAPSRNITIINNTKNVTNIKVVNNSVVNYGPDVRIFEKERGAKIRKINVVESDLTATRGGAKINQLKGDKFYAFRPHVVKKGNETPILKGNVKKVSLGIENKKDDLVAPKYEKTTRKNETFIHKNNFEDPSNQDYRIEKLGNKKGNLLRNKNEDIRIPNQNSFEELPNRRNSIKLENKKRGNSLVRGSAFQAQVRHTSSEDKYPSHKNLEKKPLSESNDLRQPKKENKGSYLSPRVNKDLDYRSDLNVGKERIYKQGSTPQLQKNVKSDLYRYQGNRETLNHQSKLRIEPKNSRNPKHKF
jgi:hypothetical protein